MKHLKPISFQLIPVALQLSQHASLVFLFDVPSLFPYTIRIFTSLLLRAKEEAQLDPTASVLSAGNQDEVG